MADPIFTFNGLPVFAARWADPAETAILLDVGNGATLQYPADRLALPDGIIPSSFIEAAED